MSTEHPCTIPVIKRIASATKRDVTFASLEEEEVDEDRVKYNNARHGSWDLRWRLSIGYWEGSETVCDMGEAVDRLCVLMIGRPVAVAVVNVVRDSSDVCGVVTVILVIIFFFFFFFERCLECRSGPGAPLMYVTVSSAVVGSRLGVLVFGVEVAACFVLGSAGLQVGGGRCLECGVPSCLIMETRCSRASGRVGSCAPTTGERVRV